MVAEITMIATIISTVASVITMIVTIKMHKNRKGGH